MKYIVARHSPKAGFIEPLSTMFSVHDCTRAREIGIKDQYDSREEAERDAQRLERHVNDPSCIYNATRLAATEHAERVGRARHRLSA